EISIGPSVKQAGLPLRNIEDNEESVPRGAIKRCSYLEHRSRPSSVNFHVCVRTRFGLMRRITSGSEVPSYEVTPSSATSSTILPYAPRFAPPPPNLTSAKPISAMPGSNGGE